MPIPSLGPIELAIILVIVLAIFGAGRLSALGGALGRSIRDFRKEVSEDKSQVEPAAPAAPTPSASVAEPSRRSCSACGAEIAAGARFCPSCGVQLSDAAPSAPGPVSSS